MKIKPRGHAELSDRFRRPTAYPPWEGKGAFRTMRENMGVQTKSPAWLNDRTPKPTCELEGRWVSIPFVRLQAGSWVGCWSSLSLSVGLSLSNHKHIYLPSRLVMSQGKLKDEHLAQALTAACILSSSLPSTEPLALAGLAW